MTEERRAGVLMEDDWPKLAGEINEFGKNHPLLADQIWQLIEEVSVHGGNKMQAEMLEKLSKRIEHLEKENTSLRQRMAWAVKSE